jgi:hypothetical protein
LRLIVSLQVNHAVSFFGDNMAKRSRRARKQSSEKAIPVEAAPVVSPVEEKPVETPTVGASSPRGAVVNFAEEYYYVYTDLQNVIVIAAVMFALMFGLGYFI